MKKLLSIIALVCAMQATYAQQSRTLHLRREMWNVQPFKTICYGMLPMQCIEYSQANQKETNTCFGIKGFTLMPNVQYQLLVQVDSLIHPPSDGSVYVYQVLKIISKKPATKVAMVNNKKWILTKMWHPERAPISEGLMKMVDLQINAKSFYGKSFCNNYSASYSKKATQWQLSTIACTKMFCEPNMELEQRYFQLLETLAFVVTEKNSLKFYNQEGDLILEYLEQKK